MRPILKGDLKYVQEFLRLGAIAKDQG